MKYITNEGVLEIPKSWVNQTVHVLTEKLGKPGLSLTITKENVGVGTDINTFTKDQFKKIEEELPEIEWLGKESCRIGGKQGMLVEYQWTAPQGRMHIFQAVVISGEIAVFITLNSLEAFFKRKEYNLLFIDIVNSYKFL